MRTIHRITNICITAKLKTGGVYYTQVRIIFETLQYMQMCDHSIYHTYCKHVYIANFPTHGGVFKLTYADMCENLHIFTCKWAIFNNSVPILQCQSLQNSFCILFCKFLQHKASKNMPRRWHMDLHVVCMPHFSAHFDKICNIFCAYYATNQSAYCKRKL